MRMSLAAASSAAAMVLFASLQSCTGSPDGVVVEPPDFSGSWVLNDEESDDPREQMRSAMQGGMGGRGGGAGGGRRGGRGGMDPGSMRQTMQSAMQAARVLKITQNDSTVTVADADGNKRVLFPDGRKIKREFRGREFEIEARWKDDKLVVEREVAGGAKLTETYERADGSAQLHVKIKMSGGGMPRTIEFRRVYDLAQLSG